MDKQVQELNAWVKTYLAPSKIHGVGVFALRDIAKGQHLGLDNLPKVYTLPYSSFGKLFPEVKKLILQQWPRVVEGARFAYPVDRSQAYMNHNDSPNYDAVNDVLLADVKKGEEITEDYRLIPGHEKVFKWLVKKD